MNRYISPISSFHRLFTVIEKVSRERVAKGIAITAALVSIILLAPGKGHAGTGSNTNGADLSVNLGVERLAYEEDEPETRLKSDATTYNLVAGFEGRKYWRFLFFGIRGKFAVVAGDDREKWNRSGSLIQTNRLENRWMRLGGYIGYPFKRWFNPYTGIRYSQVEQNRNDFVILGNPSAGSAKEKVTSTSLLFGARGRGNIQSGWEWSYRMEFFIPLDVEVTNSALPGFRASEKDGYALELESGIMRMLSGRLGVGLSLYGGKTHWEGSDFKPFSGGSAKWPENDTTYFGTAINVRWFL
jgi:hypothetical protein